MGFVDNMNAIIVGPSGTGKSFTTNTIVRNMYNDGQHIFIIDVGDSYQGLCRVINEETNGRDGVYNTYDPNNPFGFNPFHGRNHGNEVDADGEGRLNLHAGMVGQYLVEDRETVEMIADTYSLVPVPRSKKSQ